MLDDDSKPERQKPPIKRFLFVLRLLLPVVVFFIGIAIIQSPYLLADFPKIQKDAIGVVFMTYAVFRVVVIIRNERA